MKQSLTHRISSLIVNNPRKSLLASFVLIALLVPGVLKLQSNFSYRIWYQESDPLLLQFDEFQQRFGNDDNIVILIHHEDGIFTKESVELIQQVTDAIWLAPEIIRVDSLSNYNWTYAQDDDIIIEPFLPDDIELTKSFLSKRQTQAVNHEILPGYLVSKDAKTALIFATIKPAMIENIQTGKITPTSANYEYILYGNKETKGIKTIISEFEATSNHTFFVTGTGALDDAFREASVKDMSFGIPLLLGMVALFLMIFLKRTSGVVLPFILIFLVLGTTFGFEGYAGLKFNPVTSIIPNTLIAISIADIIHILVTFFGFFNSGLNQQEAIKETLIKNLRPTFLTSLSTSLGFFSFATSQLQPLADMGIIAGVGALLAWILTILFIIPLLSFIPFKRKELVLEEENYHTYSSPLAQNYIQWINRNRKKITYGFLALTLTSAYIGLQNEVNSDPFKYFSDDVHLTQAQNFMEANVGGSSGPEIVINTHQEDGIKNPEFLKKVDQFQQWLNSKEYVTKTISIVDIIKQMNRSFHEDKEEFYRIPESQPAVAQLLFLYTMSLPQGMNINDRMTLKNDALRLTALWTMHESNESIVKMKEIESKAQEMGLDIQMTGKLPLAQKLNGYVVKSFIISLLLATIGISLLMVIFFKSWRIGLFSMIPNFVPLIFGSALMTILDKPLDIGTVLVISVCLGIAVDDTIHFLSHYHSLITKGFNSEQALVKVLTQTAPSLIITTIILVIGFGTSVFGSFVPTINFGILTALILSSALLSDVILIPALLLNKSEELAPKTKLNTTELHSALK